MLTSIYNRKSVRAFLAMLSLMAYAAPTFAHHAMGGKTPETFDQGLLSGFAHPVIGLDHFAFLVVIALLAMILKSPARYLVPLSFVVATVAGTAVHLAAINLPMTETIIAASLLLGGGLLLLRKDLSGLLLSVMSALFGVFHGYAYGESIVGAESTPLLAYLIGFAIIQYVVMLGIVFGVAKFTQHSTTALQNKLRRAGGAMAVLIGGLFMALSFA